MYLAHKLTFYTARSLYLHLSVAINFPIKERFFELRIAIICGLTKFTDITYCNGYFVSCFDLFLLIAPKIYIFGYFSF